jgi:hypothetical protein
MSHSIRVLFGCLAATAIIAGLIWASNLLDRRWRDNHPTDRPFRWGYFQALGFFPGGLSWFIVPFFARVPVVVEVFELVVYGLVGSYAGYVLIRKKKKWAWIYVVIAQPNLINWFINIYYGGKRWNEFN